MNKKDQKIEQICTIGIEAILERAELAMKMHDIRQDLTKQQTKE